jgi:hypothetical protein
LTKYDPEKHSTGWIYGSVSLNTLPHWKNLSELRNHSLGGLKLMGLIREKSPALPDAQVD